MKDSRYQKFVADGFTPIATSLIPKERLFLYTARVEQVKKAQEQGLVPKFQAHDPFMRTDEYPWCFLGFDLVDQVYGHRTFKTQKAAATSIPGAGDRYLIVPIQDALLPKTRSVEVEL